MERPMNYEVDYNSHAFALGWEAWDVHVESNFTIKSPNPFKEDDINHWHWNSGWTRNFKGIK